MLLLVLLVVMLHMRLRWRGGQIEGGCVGHVLLWDGGMHRSVSVTMRESMRMGVHGSRGQRRGEIEG